jgi:two-component system response regulator
VKRRILLVEDNPDHALLTTEAVLSVHGVDVEVIHAPGGREALEMLFDDGLVPDLVLLDVKMPEVDGFDVLRRIKEDERLRVIPIVMLTSSDDERDVAKSYGLGSNSFVQKPVDADALHDRVSHIPSYWFNVNRAAEPAKVAS